MWNQILEGPRLSAFGQMLSMPPAQPLAEEHQAYRVRFWVVEGEGRRGEEVEKVKKEEEKKRKRTKKKTKKKRKPR